MDDLTDGGRMAGEPEGGKRADDALIDDEFALERGRRGLAKTIDDYPKEKQAVYRRLLNDGLARAKRAREASEHPASGNTAAPADAPASEPASSD